jgi:hypothetical protein
MLGRHPLWHSIPKRKATNTDAIGHDWNRFVHRATRFYV